MKDITVSKVMRTNIAFIDGMQTVGEALAKLYEYKTKCLIVNKRDENDEYGVLVVSDIAKKVLAKDKSVSRTNVYEIMSKPIITIRPDMNIKYCARLFERFRLSRAPVQKNGEIVGIISLSDMVINGMCKLADYCKID